MTGIKYITLKQKSATGRPTILQPDQALSSLLMNTETRGTFSSRKMTQSVNRRISLSSRGLLITDSSEVLGWRSWIYVITTISRKDIPILSQLQYFKTEQKGSTPHWELCSIVSKTQSYEKYIVVLIFISYVIPDKEPNLSLWGHKRQESQIRQILSFFHKIP